MVAKMLQFHIKFIKRKGFPYTVTGNSRKAYGLKSMCIQMF